MLPLMLSAQANRIRVSCRARTIRSRPVTDNQREGIFPRQTQTFPTLRQGVDKIRGIGLALGGSAAFAAWPR